LCFFGEKPVFWSPQIPGSENGYFMHRLLSVTLIKKATSTHPSSRGLSLGVLYVLVLTNLVAWHEYYSGCPEVVCQVEGAHW
jgi:hypothetical protein